MVVYDRLERIPTQEGYHIRLGSPALIELRACLTPNLLKKVVDKFGRARGSKSAAPSVYDHKINRLADFRVFPVYTKSAPINRRFLGDTFADPLFESGKLHYNKAFARYEIIGQGSTGRSVRVHFADGTSDDCGLLIGADGSHSKVGLSLDPKDILRLTRYLGEQAARLGKH